MQVETPRKLLARILGLTNVEALQVRVEEVRPALPLVVLAGLLEAIGSGIYVVAASTDIAVAAVLSSQFAGIAAVGSLAANTNANVPSARPSTWSR